MAIAVTNQKGGVGKTAVSINLAAAMALLGQKTLVVDIDPQANASDGLGIDTAKVTLTTYDAMVNDADLAATVKPTSQKNLWIAPSSIHLSGAETELAALPDRLFRLRRAMGSLSDEYDRIFVDCPPSLGILTVNGIIACDDIIIPVEPKGYSLNGMAMLLKTVLKIREDTDSSPNVKGILINMFDGRKTLQRSVAGTLINSLCPNKVFKAVIHRDERISEAELEGRPVVQSSPAARCSKEFISVAREIMNGSA